MSTFFVRRCCVEQRVLFCYTRCNENESSRTVAHNLISLSSLRAPLTPEQIDFIVNIFESDEDNMIDYNSFLDAFVVVDLWSDLKEGATTSGASAEALIAKQRLSVCVCVCADVAA